MVLRDASASKNIYKIRPLGSTSMLSKSTAPRSTLTGRRCSLGRGSRSQKLNSLSPMTSWSSQLGPSRTPSECRGLPARRSLARWVPQGLRGTTFFSWSSWSTLVPSGTGSSSVSNERQVPQFLRRRRDDCWPLWLWGEVPPPSSSPASSTTSWRGTWVSGIPILPTATRWLWSRLANTCSAPSTRPCPATWSGSSRSGKSKCWPGNQWKKFEATVLSWARAECWTLVCASGRLEIHPWISFNNWAWRCLGGLLFV